ncbi:hypothetical protein AWV80_26775 [Cupriavidus sp. UYMU48A]|nr:hypothetical protein AWV80_26775 [Cupriavidus sp. UYMU48A]
MKRLPIRFFLLCLPLLALPHPGHAASLTAACTVVQAAGLSLAERHAAAKASAEAALDPAQHCSDGAVRVMADPDSDGRPLQLHDSRDEAESAPAQGIRLDSRCAAHDRCTMGALPELPAAALAHYTHAAAMVSTSMFAGAFTSVPSLP